MVGYSYVTCSPSFAVKFVAAFSMNHHISVSGVMNGFVICPVVWEAGISTYPKSLGSLYVNGNSVR